MKKSISILVWAFLSIQLCLADDYRITYLDGDSIQIGKENCTINSVFPRSEIDNIQWTRSKVTYIKARNVKTGKLIELHAPQSHHTSDSSSKLSGTRNHYVSKSYLSTRETYIYDLDEALTKEDFQITSPSDTIRIRTNDTDTDKKYYASYYLNGEKQTIELPIDKGDLVFEYNYFTLNNVTLPYKYILTIYYIKGDSYHEITCGMILNIE